MLTAAERIFVLVSRVILSGDDAYSRIPLNTESMVSALVICSISVWMRSLFECWSTALGRALTEPATCDACVAKVDGFEYKLVCCELALGLFTCIMVSLGEFVCARLPAFRVSCTMILRRFVQRQLETPVNDN